MMMLSVSADVEEQPSAHASRFRASTLLAYKCTETPGRMMHQALQGACGDIASAVFEQSATAALPRAAFSISCRVWTAFSSCSQGEKQLGSSLAAAVVTAVLFFIVVVGAIANLGAAIAAAGDWLGCIACMDDGHAVTLISYSVD